MRLSWDQLIGIGIGMAILDFGRTSAVSSRLHFDSPAQESWQYSSRGLSSSATRMAGCESNWSHGDLRLEREDRVDSVRPPSVVYDAKEVLRLESGSGGKNGLAGELATEVFCPL